MARKPRIHVPGGFYHVILRGNAGQDIFYSVEDTKYFESLISEGIERFGHRVHTYCWMKNHVHMVIQVANIPLSKIIQNISFRYTLYINKKYDKTGHLFQGRYKAILIDPQSYLLQLVRYINLNPLTANIVNKPEEYRWSSYRAFVGKCRTDWLTLDYILKLFSDNRTEAIEQYQEFVQDRDEADLNIDFSSGNKHGYVLGDDLFAEKVIQASQSIDKNRMSIEKIITTACRSFDISKDQLISNDRARDLGRIRTIIGYLIIEYGSSSLSEYARYIKRDISTISGAVARYRKKLLSQSEEQIYMAKLEKELGV